MKPYDIFLVCAPKDYHKLPHVLDGIHYNLSGYNEIHLSVPDPERPFGPAVSAIQHYGVIVHKDMDILRFNPRKWAYRPNWVYQQFLKMFQDITPNEWYFVIDCDCVLLQPLPMWEDGYPIWYRFHVDQHQPAYHRFTEAFWGFGREVCKHTMLSDMNFFNKSLIQDMLASTGMGLNAFLRKSIEVITPDSHPSEADTYMGYVEHKHPGYYRIKEIRNRCLAKEGSDPFQHLWTPDEMNRRVAELRSEGYQTASLHSWIDRSHSSWRQ